MMSVKMVLFVPAQAEHLSEESPACSGHVQSRHTGMPHLSDHALHTDQRALPDRDCPSTGCLLSVPLRWRGMVDKALTDGGCLIKAARANSGILETLDGVSLMVPKV